jgi:hypothetical protein
MHCHVLHQVRVPRPPNAASLVACATSYSLLSAEKWRKHAAPKTRGPPSITDRYEAAGEVGKGSAEQLRPPPWFIVAAAGEHVLHVR